MYNYLMMEEMINVKKEEPGMYGAQYGDKNSKCF